MKHDRHVSFNCYCAHSVIVCVRSAKFFRAACALVITIGFCSVPLQMFNSLAKRRKSNGVFLLHQKIASAQHFLVCVIVWAQGRR